MTEDTRVGECYFCITSGVSKPTLQDNEGYEHTLAVHNHGREK